MAQSSRHDPRFAGTPFIGSTSRIAALAPVGATRPGALVHRQRGAIGRADHGWRPTRLIGARAGGGRACRGTVIARRRGHGAGRAGSAPDSAGWWLVDSASPRCGRPCSGSGSSVRRNERGAIDRSVRHGPTSWSSCAGEPASRATDGFRTEHDAPGNWLGVGGLPSAFRA